MPPVKWPSSVSPYSLDDESFNGIEIFVRHSLFIVKCNRSNIIVTACLVGLLLEMETGDENHITK